MYYEIENDLLNGHNLDKTFKEQKEIIKQIIGADINKLSNIEYYNLLSKICRIKLTNSDYVEIAKIITNFENGLVFDIKTNMKKTFVLSEGRRRDFSWWEDNYLVGYTILSKKNISTSQIYTFFEIKDMIDRKEIFIIKPNDVRLIQDSNGYFYEEDNAKTYVNVEENKELPVLTAEVKEDSSFISHIDTNINPEDKYFDEIMNYIRTKVPKEKFELIFKKYLFKLEESLDCMINIWSDDNKTKSELQETKKDIKKMTKHLKTESDGIFKL